eukprot:14892090-Alexandrium_andersonii.AAC.1
MVPLSEAQAEVPAHEVEGPEGPVPAASLCAVRISLSSGNMPSQRLGGRWWGGPWPRPCSTSPRR